MAKQSIFGRISQLLRANINALIDQAEDPQKMLDQLVRDYTNSIADAESAIAETIGNLRLLEHDHQEDVQAAREWGNKALAASRKGDELRSAGDAADADKFDNLAKIALSARSQPRTRRRPPSRRSPRRPRSSTSSRVGLNGMKEKLGQLKIKRSELLARAKTAEAQNKVHDAVKSIDVLDPTSELGRFEDKIRRQEALVRGQAGARRLEPRRAVQRARRPRRAHRGRGAPRRAEGRRLVAGRDLGLSPRRRRMPRLTTGRGIRSFRWHPPLVRGPTGRMRSRNPASAAVAFRYDAGRGRRGARRSTRRRRSRDRSRLPAPRARAASRPVRRPPGGRRPRRERALRRCHAGARRAAAVGGRPGPRAGRRAPAAPAAAAAARPAGRRSDGPTRIRIVDERVVDARRPPARRPLELVAVRHVDAAAARGRGAGAVGPAGLEPDRPVGARSGCSWASAIATGLTGRRWVWRTTLVLIGVNAVATVLATTIGGLLGLGFMIVASFGLAVQARLVRFPDQ